MAGRRNLVRLAVAGLGLGGMGLAGVLAAERAVVRRVRQRPDPAAGDPLELPDGSRERTLIMSDGASIHVVEHGAGQPIVMVHGVTLSAAVWLYQLQDLAAAGYRAIAYDQRGHGRSEAGSAALTIDRLAADLGEVLEQLDVRRAVLVGHSMGGMVALRMLAADPLTAAGGGRIGALALVATSASPFLGNGVPGVRVALGLTRPIVTRAARLAARLPGPSLPGGDLALVVTRASFGTDPSLRQIGLTQALTAAVPARVSIELMTELLHLDEAATLARLDLPVRVVVGSRDLLTPVRHARALVQAIEGAELVVLPGCGHMVMFERRRELDDVAVSLAVQALAAVA